MGAIESVRSLGKTLKNNEYDKAELVAPPYRYLSNIFPTNRTI